MTREGTLYSCAGYPELVREDAELSVVAEARLEYGRMLFSLVSVRYERGSSC